MTTVHWAEEALEDLERLQDFLLREAPDAADAAMARIDKAANVVADFPELGRRYTPQPSEREFLTAFGAGAYVLRYRLGPQGQPIILRVFHSREHR